MAIAQKVSLKPGEKHCTRCGGYRLFFTRVENGRGVPAQPERGICYRCKGSGKEPPPKQNTRRSTQPAARQPLFKENEKIAMERIFEVIYDNDQSENPICMNHRILAKRVDMPVASVQRYVRGLINCQFVFFNYIGRKLSIESTVLGADRFDAKQAAQSR